MSVTPSPAPRGELTPEISGLLDRYGFAEREVARLRECVRRVVPINEDTLEAAECAALAARGKLLSAMASSPAPQQQPEEPRDTVLLDWLEEQRVVQVTFAERDPLFTPDSSFGVRAAIEDAISAEIVDAAMTESRDGGAAPPDLQGARRNLELAIRCVSSIDADKFANRVAATLDQAEKEIARLRAFMEGFQITACGGDPTPKAMEELGAYAGWRQAKYELNIKIKNLEEELARLRSSPPEETQQERLTRELVQGTPDWRHPRLAWLLRYAAEFLPHTDVGRERYGEMLGFAHDLEAKPPSPSVPKEDK